MNRVFLLALIFVFLTIFIESISLVLQLKGKKLTKWLGAKAFIVHMVFTGTLWIVTFCLIGILQIGDHPLFHTNTVLRYIGFILSIFGAFLAIRAFVVLGLKRSLCLNFFEENVPMVKKFPYSSIKNPEDYGLWTALIGFALVTGSLYNLVIAIEFVLIMIPHMILENMPLGR